MIVHADQIERIFDRFWKSLQKISDAVKSKDINAQRQGLVEMQKIKQELAVVKSDLHASLTQVMRATRNSAEPGNRIARLVSAFEFVAKLEVVAWDALANPKLQRLAMRTLHAIAKDLDEIGSGERLALVPLLEHEDPAVRGSAAAFLVKLLPRRALPVLRAIDAKGDGSSPCMAAFHTLFRYKVEHPDDPEAQAGV